MCAIGYHLYSKGPVPYPMPPSKGRKRRKPNTFQVFSYVQPIDVHTEPVYTSLKMRTRQAEPPPHMAVNTAHGEYYLRITPQHAIQNNSISGHIKYETRYHIEILRPAGPGCNCPSLSAQGALRRIRNLRSRIETMQGGICRPGARLFGAALHIQVMGWRMNPGDWRRIFQAAQGRLWT